MTEESSGPGADDRTGFHDDAFGHRSDDGESNSDDPGSTETDTRAADEPTVTRSNAERIPIDLDGGGANQPVDETGSGGDHATDGPSAAAVEDEDEEYGPEPSSTPIEAGSPDTEHVLFVILGAIAMLAVLAQLASVI